MEKETYDAAVFQSTLSVRRATKQRQANAARLGISIHALRKESDPASDCAPASVVISIHALRKESDLLALNNLMGGRVISIHALRKESDLRHSPHRRPVGVISIHALRKESDTSPCTHHQETHNFNPRSP